MRCSPGWTRPITSITCRSSAARAHGLMGAPDPVLGGWRQSYTRGHSCRLGGICGALLPDSRESRAESACLSLPFKPACLRCAVSVGSLFVVLPTSWRGAGRRFFDPGGRPGPGLPGFGASAGQGMVVWMFLNPRRTRAGVSRPGGAGRSQGRRRSSASGRARRS